MPRFITAIVLSATIVLAVFGNTVIDAQASEPSPSGAMIVIIPALGAIGAVGGRKRNPLNIALEQLDDIDIPHGYYDGMCDPLYAYESTGSLVMWEEYGNDVAAMCEHNLPTADKYGDDGEADMMREAIDILRPIVDATADHVDAMTEHMDTDVMGYGRHCADMAATFLQYVLPDGWMATVGSPLGARSGYRVSIRRG